MNGARAVRQLCPRCVQRVDLECACGPGLPCPDPGRVAGFILDLSPFEDWPRPETLLAQARVGPRMYRDAAWERVAAWCHRGTPLALWQESTAPLLTLSSRRRSASEEELRSLRLLGACDFVLLEPGDQSPLDRARYRCRHPNAEPPPPAHVVAAVAHGRAQLASEPGEALALVCGPGSPARASVNRELDASLFKRVRSFERRSEALSWLLDSVPEQRQPLAAALARARLGLTDLGGVTVRRILAQLHARSLASFERRKRLHGRVKRWFPFAARSLRPMPSVGQRWARMDRLRACGPAPREAIPRWKGSVRRGVTVRVGLWDVGRPRAASRRSSSEALALVVGLGASARRGECELAQLIERSWRGEVWPVALLSDPETHPSLLRSARSCFPGALELRATANPRRPLLQALDELERISP